MSLVVKEVRDPSEARLFEPPSIVVHRSSLTKTPQPQQPAGEVCLLVESPYRIIRVGT